MKRLFIRRATRFPGKNIFNDALEKVDLSSKTFFPSVGVGVGVGVGATTFRQMTVSRKTFYPPALYFLESFA